MKRDGDRDEKRDRLRRRGIEMKRDRVEKKDRDEKRER